MHSQVIISLANVIHIFLISIGLEEMAGEAEYVQTKHKEEGQSRIRTDGEDRIILRQKVAVCIHPMRPEEHKVKKSLINIDSGEIVLNEDVNVDEAPSIGQVQMDAFVNAWPEGFYVPIKRQVIRMNADRKSIDVDGLKVTDTGIFWARALAFKDSGRENTPSIERMLETELSPLALSMFDEDGKMRKTQKSVLKQELAVERPIRGIHKDAYFLDGCAVLWVVPYPTDPLATVHTFVRAFKKAIRDYQDVATTYLMLDR